MQQVADRARRRPAVKTRRLVDWIGANLWPGLPPSGEALAGAPPRRNDRQLVVFVVDIVGRARYNGPRNDDDNNPEQRRIGRPG